MKKLFEQPWIWALLGVVGLWILLSIGTGQVNLGNLAGIVASAALLCVVAIGQMLVVTTGDGAIDLSIPSVITLSAFVLTSVTNGQDGRLALGLLVVAAIGALVGWVNALIVNGLRIPPIIATLAVGYILTTATLIYNRGFTTYAVSPLLAYVASGRVFGFPLILILAIVLTGAISWLLKSSVYGRNLSAVGQNRRAAHFAGIRLEPTSRIAYVLSGVLAAIGGALLSGRVSGAFLEMGNPFFTAIGRRCGGRRLFDHGRKRKRSRHSLRLPFSGHDRDHHAGAPGGRRLSGHCRGAAHHSGSRGCDRRNQALKKSARGTRATSQTVNELVGEKNGNGREQKR